MSRANLVGVLALAPILVLSACSSSDSEATRSPGTPATSTPQSTVGTVASVTGRLDEAGQTAVREAIVPIITDALAGAYLGDFPRTDFAAAFAAYTEGARSRAQKDLDLLTSAVLAARITRAELTQESVALDIYAAKNTAAGVTARWTLDFVTSGDLASNQTVKGSFDLTPVDGGWRIFGYDLTRGPAVPVSGASASPTTAPSSTGALR